MRRRVRTVVIALLLALAGVAGGPPPAALAGDYPLEGGNEYRWFHFPDAMFPYVHMKTIAPSGHGKATEGTAIVENDIAYIPSTETGRIIAYHLTDDRVVWISSAIPNMSGQPVSPVIVGDRLVVTVVDRFVVLNKNTGTVIKTVMASASDGWRNKFPSGPLAWGNKVFNVSNNFRFYGIVATDQSTTPFLAWNSGKVLAGAPVLMDRGTSGTSDDYIIFTADGVQGTIYVFRPSNNQMVESWDTPEGIGGSSVAKDGNTWFTTTKRGRFYRVNVSNLSIWSSNTFYNANPGGWSRLRPLSYNPATGYLFANVKNLDNDYGYVVRFGQDGSYAYIYSSSYDVSGAVATFPNGGQLFVREDGTIIGRTTGGGDFNWYQGGNDTYKMAGAGSFTTVNVIGGDMKSLLVPSDAGIEIFRPAYPNFRGTDITVTDGNGNQKTTFYKNETVRIVGAFANTGPVGANNVQHVLIKNGGWVQYANANYSVGGRPNVTFSYSARSLGVGTHTVSVRADPNGNVTEIDETDNNTPSASITILNRVPTADFTWSPNIPLVGQTVTFTNRSSDPDGDPLTYRWEYRRPGSSSWMQFSTSANPTLTVDAAGTWTIRLTATDDSGGSDSVQKTITVNRPPVANFTWSPNIPLVGQTVTFTNQSSDPDGDPLTYRWEYRRPGSSSWVQFSTSANPTLTVDAAGTWTIRLTVSDNKGASSSVTKNVVVNTAPVANFTWSPNIPQVGQTVSFTNASSDPDGDPLTYRWEYQQPGSSSWVQFSTAANPTLTVNVAGTWTIRLTVSDNKGASASVTKSIVVNTPPVADFTWSPSIPQVGQTVSFTNASSDPDGDPLTYRWEYQRPGSSTWVQFSTATNPTLTVDVGGAWSIRLTVQDNRGGSASVTKSVTVNTAPIANFTWSPGTLYTGDTITFTNTSSDPDGDPLTYLWEYRRPGSSAWVQFSTARNPTLTPDIDGAWSIRLTVWDGKGGTASVTKSITVQPTWVSCIPAPNPVRAESNTTALLYCDPEAVNATVTSIRGVMPDGRVVDFAPMAGGALWRAVYDVKLNQGAYSVTYRVSGTSASGRPLQADVPVTLLVGIGAVPPPDPGTEIIGPQPGQPFKIRLTR